MINDYTIYLELEKAYFLGKNYYYITEYNYINGVYTYNRIFYKRKKILQGHYRIVSIKVNYLCELIVKK